MTSERPPSAPKPPADPQSEREAKLAEALRTNLRRRKTASAPKPEKPPGGDSA
jgi:hypothetical protein